MSGLATLGHERYFRPDVLFGGGTHSRRIRKAPKSFFHGHLSQQVETSLKVPHPSELFHCSRRFTFKANRSKTTPDLRAVCVCETSELFFVFFCSTSIKFAECVNLTWTV